MTLSQTAVMFAAMPPLSLFVIAVIGLLAGVVARWIVGRHGSTFAALGLGVAGALAGVLVGGLLGLRIESLLSFAAAAVCGATTLLALTALAFRRR